MEHALAFDRVRPADHEAVGKITPALVTLLKARSAERIKASKEFAKFGQDIDRLKTSRERKQVPLSEAELKAQMNKEEAEQADPDNPDGPPEPKNDEGVYKFQRNFVGTEILKIMEDLIQGKQLAPAPQGRRKPAPGFLNPALYQGHPAPPGRGSKRLTVPDKACRLKEVARFLIWKEIHEHRVGPRGCTCHTPILVARVRSRHAGATGRRSVLRPYRRCVHAW